MTRYSIDTRTLQPGDIFIPVKGERFDGHNYIDEAKRKGASKIFDVALGPFASEQRRKFKIPVIGVTGSAGKTTVKNTLAAVLAEKFKTVATEHNFNNEVGVPLTLLRIDETTQAAVIEMALRNTGDLKLLAEWVAPTHVIITNIGFTHLAQFENRDALARAKAEIFLGTPSPQVAYINAQDEYRDLLTKLAQARGILVKTFLGFDAFSQNEAAVRAVALDLAVSEVQIELGLKNVAASPHRLVQHTLASGQILIDDSYNANPHSMRAACGYARDMALSVGARRTVPLPVGLVLGDMLELGAESHRLHQELIDWIFENIAPAWMVWVGEQGARLSWPAGRDVTCVGAWEAGLEKVKLKVKLKVKPEELVLVKASRGIKLDLLVEALLK